MSGPTATSSSGTSKSKDTAMKHDDSHEHSNTQASLAVIEVDLKNAYDGSEYADLERCFLGLPGVTGAHLDRT